MVAPAYYDSNTPFWTPDGEARALWLLRPKAGLADDHDYALRIKPGLKSALGAQTGKESRSVETFRTFASPRLIGVRCSSDGATRRVVPGATCAPLHGGRLVFHVRSDGRGVGNEGYS